MRAAEIRNEPPRPPAARPRVEAKRLRILDASMRHFAERGYHATRIEDIATELSIAKGSVFQHFGSKEGLFLSGYKKAVVSFPAWLAAPTEIVAKGFFATLRYWLHATHRPVRQDLIPHRIAPPGNQRAEPEAPHD